MLELNLCYFILYVNVVLFNHYVGLLFDYIMYNFVNAGLQSINIHTVLSKSCNER